MLPVGILLFIAVPSLSLLYALEELNGAAGLVIQVVGRQWYWVYEYPSFAVNLLEVEPLETEAELRDPLNEAYARMGLRLLDSSPLLLPLALEVEFLTASEDVIHSFALPSVGLKLDAVPGRLNMALSTLLRLGILYGQCSELCGSGHGFMPITAQVVVQPLLQLTLLEKANLLRDYLEQWLLAAGNDATITALAEEEPQSSAPADDDAKAKEEAMAAAAKAKAEAIAAADAARAMAAAASYGVIAAVYKLSDLMQDVYGTLNQELPPHQWTDPMLDFLQHTFSRGPNMAAETRPLMETTDPNYMPVLLRDGLEAGVQGVYVEALQWVQLSDPGLQNCRAPRLLRFFVEGGVTAENLEKVLQRLQGLMGEGLERCFTMKEAMDSFKAPVPTAADNVAKAYETLCDADGGPKPQKTAIYLTMAAVAAASIALQQLALVLAQCPPLVWPPELLDFMQHVYSVTDYMASETRPLMETNDPEVNRLMVVRRGVEAGVQGVYVEARQWVSLEGGPHSGGRAPRLVRFFVEGDVTRDNLTSVVLRLHDLMMEGLERTFTLKEALDSFKPGTTVTREGDANAAADYAVAAWSSIQELLSLVQLKAPQVMEEYSSHSWPSNLLRYLQHFYSLTEYMATETRPLLETTDPSFNPVLLRNGLQDGVQGVFVEALQWVQLTDPDLVDARAPRLLRFFVEGGVSAENLEDVLRQLQTMSAPGLERRFTLLEVLDSYEPNQRYPVLGKN